MAKVEVEDRGAVRVLRINRAEVHNAVDGETAGQIEAAIDAFGADDAARVMVVTGAGDKAFCAGADLTDLTGIGMRAGKDRSSPMGFARLDPGKPTLAAVNGYCFAGGVELAAWCDFRIADERAEFGVLNRRWGIPLIDGGTQRLPRIMGLGNALYLIAAGVRIGAARALELGLVQEVVPAGTSVERALVLAEAIASYPQVGLRGDRAAALAGFNLDLAEGLNREAEIGDIALTDPELPEAIARFAGPNRPESPRG